MNVKLIFFLLVLTPCFVEAQSLGIWTLKERTKIEVKVEKHLWLDNKNYQFIAVSVIGLPEINTLYSWQPSDTIDEVPLRSIRDFDGYCGGYSSPVLISQNQTFQPIKTMKETVYDSLSKSNKVKVTSLFLLDDFKKVKNKETLFLICQGVFGYPRQSFARMETFTSDLSINQFLLITNDDCLSADKNWYKTWLKNAPPDYWDPRMKGHYYEQHQSFDFFLEELNGGAK